VHLLACSGIDHARIDAQERPWPWRDAAVSRWFAGDTCQAACPSRAIVFGESRPGEPGDELKADPRNYGVLSDWARGADKYLVALRNPIRTC